MRCIPKYRVCYNGKFYSSGEAFNIDAKDADEMKQHGRLVDNSMPPTPEAKRPGRPRRVENGQSGEAETKNRGG